MWPNERGGRVYASESICWSVLSMQALRHYVCKADRRACDRAQVGRAFMCARRRPIGFCLWDTRSFSLRPPCAKLWSRAQPLCATPCRFRCSPSPPPPPPPLPPPPPTAACPSPAPMCAQAGASRSLRAEVDKESVRGRLVRGTDARGFPLHSCCRSSGPLVRMSAKR